MKSWQQYSHLLQPQPSLKPGVGHSAIFVGHRLNGFSFPVDQHKDDDQERHSGYREYGNVPAT